MKQVIRDPDLHRKLSVMVSRHEEYYPFLSYCRMCMKSLPNNQLCLYFALYI